ncbi:MAG TPA: hypothetical protein VF593_07695, partial [Chthoniobacteraceae bacterium]
EKARSIRMALEVTAEAIGIPLTDAIPVALPSDAGSYNVELVWARIVALLPKAQQIQLNRLMTDSRTAWNVWDILSQAGKGGKMLLTSVLKSDTTRMLFDATLQAGVAGATAIQRVKAKRPSKPPE